MHRGFQFGGSRHHVIPRKVSRAARQRSRAHPALDISKLAYTFCLNKNPDQGNVTETPIMDPDHSAQGHGVPTLDIQDTRSHDSP